MLFIDLFFNLKLADGSLNGVAVMVYIVLIMLSMLFIFESRGE